MDPIHANPAERLVIVLSTLAGRTVGRGEAAALSQLTPMLEDLGVAAERVQVVYSADLSPEALADKPRVLIGGPRYNAHTAHLMNKLSLKYRFARPGGRQVEQKIYDQTSDASFAPSIHIDQYGAEVATLDYGTLIKCKVPGEESFAIIMAGCRSPGVFLAARAAASSSFIDSNRDVLLPESECDLLQVILRGELPENFVLRQRSLKLVGQYTFRTS